MRVHQILLATMLAGCFGSTLPPANDDAGYGRAPDLPPVCRGDNDGVIAREELQFPLNLAVRYLVNPPGTTVTVDPKGTMRPDGAEWDLTSTAGEVHELVLEPIAGRWFEATFAGASYVTTSDLASGILGVFRVAADGLQILGFASREPNRTLLVYDAPVVSLRLPVRAGDAWVTGARIVNGTLDGRPFASSDTYRVSVDAKGTAVLPFLRFDNTLRVRVELTQTLPGGVAVTRTQHLFFHECYGELGRMVSTPGETNVEFTTAAEFRRLAL